MTEQLVSHSAGFTRLGKDAGTTADELGPLADLVGTWIGTGGWELIAVPAPSEGGHEEFELIIKQYVEIVSFEPIGAQVPDRGGDAGILCLGGLKYDMRIASLDSNEPLHLENGMWFYMPGQDQEIARSSAIPHGDCLLALGNATQTPGAPDLPVVPCTPDGQPVNAPFGYADHYKLPESSPFQTSDANLVLRNILKNQTVTETTTLDVSTANGGGVLNIPFVTKNANAAAFQSTYWIETVTDPVTKQPFQQLQYSQCTNIQFFENEVKPGHLIQWPHVNVNTLRKQ
jgi:hypothetical protein